MNLEQRGYALLARKTRYSYGATLAEHCMHAYRIAVLRAKPGNMYRRCWIQAYLHAKREHLGSAHKPSEKPHE